MESVSAMDVSRCVNSRFDAFDAFSKLLATEVVGIWMVLALVKDSMGWTVSNQEIDSVRNLIPMLLDYFSALRVKGPIVERRLIRTTPNVDARNPLSVVL